MKCDMSMALDIEIDLKDQLHELFLDEINGDVRPNFLLLLLEVMKITDEEIKEISECIEKERMRVHDNERS